MMFKHLEENRQSELNYCIGLTENLEEPTKITCTKYVYKNINGMVKNEKKLLYDKNSRIVAVFCCDCN